MQTKITPGQWHWECAAAMSMFFFSDKGSITGYWSWRKAAGLWKGFTTERFGESFLDKGLVDIMACVLHSDCGNSPEMRT